MIRFVFLTAIFISFCCRSFSLKYSEGSMISCAVGVYYVHNEQLHLMKLAHVQALQLDFGDVIRIDCASLNLLPIGAPLPLPADEFAREIKRQHSFQSSTTKECNYPETAMVSCGSVTYFVFGGVLREMDDSYMKELQLKPNDIHHITCDSLNTQPIGEKLPLPAQDYIQKNPALLRLRNGFKEEGYCEAYHTNQFSACDRISIGAFVHNADLFFGTGINNNVPKLGLKMINISDPSILKGRKQSVIFVENPSIPEFVNQIIPKIEGVYVVISGNSDISVPGGNADLLTKALREPRLVHWYSMNCNSLMMPQKFSCLPEGIVHFGPAGQRLQFMYESGYGLIDGLYQNLTSLRNKNDKQNYLFSAFSVPNNYNERLPCQKHFCGATSQLKNYSRCHTIIIPDALADTRMHHLQYYRLMAGSRFVVSPPGIGLDCYRTYEALWMGSYPIVKSSALDSLYKDLPVLIVNDWQEVTVALLEATYQSFQQIKFDFSSLYMHHWNHTFRKHFY